MANDAECRLLSHLTPAAAPLLLLLVPAIVLTIALNILVAVAVVVTPALRKKTRNLYVFALSLCDCAVGFSWPLLLMQMLFGCWPLPEWTCSAWQALSVVALTSSKFLLPLLCYDAYRMITLGMSYGIVETMASGRRRIVAAFLIVCALVGYANAVTVHRGAPVLSSEGTCQLYAIVEQGNALSSGLMIAFGDVAPIVVLVLFQMITYRALRTHLRSAQWEMTEWARAQQTAKDKAAFRTMLLLSVTFIVCLAPDPISEVLFKWCGADDDAESSDEEIGCGLTEQRVTVVHHAAMIVLYANSLINPLLYAYAMPDIRQALKRLLGCKGVQTGSASAAQYNSNVL